MNIEFATNEIDFEKAKIICHYFGIDTDVIPTITKIAKGLNRAHKQGYHKGVLDASRDLSKAISRCNEK